MSNSSKFNQVDYNVLDRAKGAFIEASKRTLRFAEKFGFVPDERLGASANVFALDLKPFLKLNSESLYVTLLPEGLGTADDARPEDLSHDELLKFWFNIGIKTVSVMTNDAASSGMQPILLGLYLPSSTPERVFTPEFMSGFLDGFVEGCRQVGCVYFSGETPELRTKIIADRLDIAGALFGVVPPGVAPVDSSKISAGDQIVFIASSGPHENGFTPLRAIAEKLPQGYRTKMSDGKMFWEGMNAPSVLYTPLIQKLLLGGVNLTNVENITGHGWQKIMRPSKALRYRIKNTLPPQPVFTMARDAKGVKDGDMVSIFNYGVGMAVFVRSVDEASRVVDIAKSIGYSAIHAGVVEASESRSVVVEPYNIELKGEDFSLSKG